MIILKADFNKKFIRLLKMSSFSPLSIVLRLPIFNGNYYFDHPILTNILGLFAL
jgi:hypothetical protein